jgi:cytochrome c peroxidase
MITLLSLLIACSNDQPVAEPVNPQITDAVTVDPTRLAAFKPVPVDFFDDGVEVSPAVIDLGNRLFLDARLSASGKISCNSCHNLETNGADTVALSLGHEGKPVGRNSPTVFNAAGHVAQFWDGRAPDVEKQALGPILAPGEMAMPSPEAVVKVIKSDKTYVDAFRVAFPGVADPVTFENVGVAIGAFERTLAKPSRFDKFLSGDSNALGNDEKRGLNEFVDAGCTGCHNGALLGGTMFMKVGTVNPWPNQQDQGKFDLTKNEADRMVFKVPSLRWATETAPYFHDGSVADLPTAIKMMGHHQLGKELTDAQAASIAAFLGSTSGPVE